MQPFVCHFISGDAFFTGNAFIIFATVLLTLTRNHWLRRLALFATIIGVLFIMLSATPTPEWIYILALTLILSWLWAETRPPSRLQPCTRMCVLATSLLFVLHEWPYHRDLPLPPDNYRQILVIGDSLSAARALERDIEPWPSLLSNQHSLCVSNFAEAGATLQTALQQAALATNTSSIVILEVGGNDLIAVQTPAAQFAADLRALLTALQSSQRIIIMLELPLPPFANRYGAIQRQLAKEFRVTLLPKHHFAKVLSGRESTTDGLHLSSAGHQKLADTIWKFIAPLVATPQTPATPAASAASP